MLGVGNNFGVIYDIVEMDICDFGWVETGFFIPDKSYIEESTSPREARGVIVRNKFRANVHTIAG